ncbi:hypothetical protein LIER_36798 [Lithospermum erythrorhizon]
MLVDTGSSTDILYLGAYDRLGLPRNLLKPADTPLTGFTGHSIYRVGIADLDFRVGEAPRTVTIRASSTIVDIFVLESSMNFICDKTPNSYIPDPQNDILI